MKQKSLFIYFLLHFSIFSFQILEIIYYSLALQFRYLFYSFSRSYIALTFNFFDHGPFSILAFIEDFVSPF